MMAPPTPWTARARLSMSESVDRPHTNDATEKMASPIGEHVAPAVDVTDDPGGEKEGGQCEGIGINHPLQIGEGGVQRTLDVRQRHVHDGDVEQQHEDGGADGDQGPPLAFEAGHLRSVSRACDGPYNVM